MPSNKGRTFPPEPLTADEVKRLIMACSNRAPTGIRNRALIVILYRGGLRISEALALRPKDIDSMVGAIRILHGKGNRARTIGLDSIAFAMIDRWLDMRAKLGITGHSPLFCTLRGDQIRSAYVRRLLPRLGRKADIAKRVHAHGLRHTHAAELAAEGVPVNVVARQLGHSNIGTTSRYLDHIKPTQLIAVMRSRAWVAP